MMLRSMTALMRTIFHQSQCKDQLQSSSYTSESHSDLLIPQLADPSIFELHCQQLILVTFALPFIMATSMDTLPAHLLPLVLEEFPQSLATACVCRAGQREPRLRCVQCGIIEEEEEEEECSTLEEDQALRSFLQTVESLRRSTR
ncbi:hypothetical protein JOB18_045181 [Solea senegalensis]|uniref:Uncharacterized protein n=1 Tax=Solea senegalensis TaxID=28829 RepID=A0AAV6Q5R3_SOLSE|nr:hypothetical protein JOB18_045181 [Solea senegalensis]